MIFLDTSAIYALADESDKNHEVAKERFRAVLEIGEPILTHNYVLVESIALIQHRLGLAAALRLARDAESFEIEWIDSVIHSEAIRLLDSARKRRVSLVDQVSFVVMRSRGVEVALAFDDDFRQEGFRLFGL